MKGFKKFLLFTAVASAVGAGVAYFLKKEKENPCPECDDDDEDLDEDDTFEDDLKDMFGDVKEGASQKVQAVKAATEDAGKKVQQVKGEVKNAASNIKDIVTEKEEDISSEIRDE